MPTTKALWPAVLLAIAGPGCTHGRSDAASSPSPGSAESRLRGSIPRPPPPQLNFPLDSRWPGTVRVSRAFPNLTIPSPTFLTHPPDGSNRIFVTSRDGQVYVFPNDDAVTRAGLFLDLSAKVHSNWEEGLLGLAFDPDYVRNGWFYVHYIERTRYDSVVARFRVSTIDPNQADPQSEFVLMRVDQPEGNHNGGMLAFGPDRLLYLSFGDGGGQGDPYNNGQNLGSVFAKILRIDPSRPSGTLNYSIPPDNPFVARPGARGETWAWGLRNPWRFSFDRQTGALWTADVGQDRFEEVDLVQRGANYGWPVYEGDQSFRNPTQRPPTDFSAPVHVLARNEASSIIGGYVYRGARMPSLQGQYVYGDFQSGNVFALRAKDGAAMANTVLGFLPHISSFGEDQDGELYVLAFNQGEIHRLTESGGGSGRGVPTLLSATGLLTDTPALRWADGVMPFGVNSPLWSDGASKSRFFVVPATGHIDFRATDAWQFPVGTVLVKHFEMQMVDGDPRSVRRLETRVFVHEIPSWAGYTYRWNPQQTDATLLTAGATETLTLRDRFGVPRLLTWSYPSRSDCLQCHTVNAGSVLGLRTEQTNRQVAWGEAKINQLDLWDAMAYFRRPIGGGARHAALCDPADPNADKMQRARSYLAANCGACHRPGGAMGGDIDLRYQTPDEKTRLVNFRPLRGDLGLPDAYRVKPRAVASSVLYERMRRLDGTRMPQLGTHAVDALALDVIRDWIDAQR